MAETLPVGKMLPVKFEPVMKNRAILEIEGLDYFFIKSFSAPEVQVEKADIHWLNVQRKVATKMTFQPMNVTVHQAIAPNAGQQIQEWLRLSTEYISGRSGYMDFYKRDITIKVLDPVGNVINRWEIRGAFLTSANFGEFSHESAELQEIQLAIEYDVAYMTF
ncbi:MAG TPA: phage tail protein [Leptospiraceae bacterium]|jgi:hypothetical protein|nr:phage tail protein [Leptospiraceae bacterium]